jgi:hypothetical protein
MYGGITMRRQQPATKSGCWFSPVRTPVAGFLAMYGGITMRRQQPSNQQQKAPAETAGAFYATAWTEN